MDISKLMFRDNLMEGERILITGGAGYIGSHTCLELLLAGYDLVVVDTPDALLVCRKQDAQRVREVLDRLQDGDQSRFA